MNLLNCRAGIERCTVRRTFTYRCRPVLTLCMSYPKVTARHSPCAEKRINDQIQTQVGDFLHLVSGELYRQAIASLEESCQSGYPFLPYEAVLQYEVTYNGHCHLSLYRDQYTFTGGAHGNTVRRSDTWNLMSGQRVPLCAFFPAGQEYKPWLIDQITRQAEKRADVLFDDYPALIRQYFDEDRFYLTPGGLAIYYQQYEIAPYATGIVVFCIPRPAPYCCK